MVEANVGKYNGVDTIDVPSVDVGLWIEVL